MKSDLSITSCAVLIGLLGLFARPSRAQITTNTALPVARAQGIVRMQVQIMRATDDPTEMNRAMTTLAAPVVGVYGVRPYLAVFGVLPTLDKSLAVDSDDGRVVRSTRGIGDVRLFARYTAFRRNARGRTMRLAPLAGVELPTGRDDVRDVRGRLPAPLQLGSGTWDPFLGLVFTWQTLAWQLDVSSSFQRNGSAGPVDFGDESRLDAAFKVRVWPRTLSRGVPGFFYANLESSLIGIGRNVSDGSKMDDTGGITWYGAPGLQYVTRRIVLEGALQVPVARELNGNGMGPRYIGIVSVRVNI
ncbi:MAG: hypothetical protein WD423_02410 [Rhodothermales bacterium]